MLKLLAVCCTYVMPRMGDGIRRAVTPNTERPTGPTIGRRPQTPPPDQAAPVQHPPASDAVHPPAANPPEAAAAPAEHTVTAAQAQRLVQDAVSLKQRGALPEADHQFVKELQNKTQNPDYKLTPEDIKDVTKIVEAFGKRVMPPALKDAIEHAPADNIRAITKFRGEIGELKAQQAAYKPNSSDFNDLKARIMNREEEIKIRETGKLPLRMGAARPDAAQDVPTRLSQLRAERLGELDKDVASAHKMATELGTPQAPAAAAAPPVVSPEQRLDAELKTQVQTHLGNTIDAHAKAFMGIKAPHLKDARIGAQNMMEHATPELIKSVGLKSDAELKVLVGEALGMVRPKHKDVPLDEMSKHKQELVDNIVAGMKQGLPCGKLREELDAAKTPENKAKVKKHAHDLGAQMVADLPAGSTMAFKATLQSDAELRSLIIEKTGLSKTGKTYEQLPKERKDVVDSMLEGLKSALPNQASPLKVAIPTRDGTTQVPQTISVNGKEYGQPKYLAEGAFGRVIQYTNPKNKDDSVVVKEFIDKGDNKMRESALPELEAHMQAMGPGGKGHPNMVGLQGAIKGDQDTLLMVMDYVKGPNLEEIKNTVNALAPVAEKQVGLGKVLDLDLDLKHAVKEKRMTEEHAQKEQLGRSLDKDLREKITSGEINEEQAKQQQTVRNMEAHKELMGQQLLSTSDALLVRQYLAKGALDGMIHVQEDADMIHLDVKPMNMMYDTQTNQVKIMDFGNSVKNERLQATQELTDANKLGTQGYMAPELMELGQFDKRADTYALGQTINELMTGHATQLAADALALKGQSTNLDKVVQSTFTQDEAQRAKLSELKKNPFFNDPLGSDERAQQLLGKICELTPLLEKARELKQADDRIVTSGADVMAQNAKIAEKEHQLSALRIQQQAAPDDEGLKSQIKSTERWITDFTGNRDTAQAELEKARATKLGITGRYPNLEQDVKDKEEEIRKMSRGNG